MTQEGKAGLSSGCAQSDSPPQGSKAEPSHPVEGEELRHPEGARSRAATPLHRNNSAEVVQASD